MSDQFITINAFLFGMAPQHRGKSALPFSTLLGSLGFHGADARVVCPCLLGRIRPEKERLSNSLTPEQGC